MQPVYTFYNHTKALEVLHVGVGLLIRYGEMRPGSTPQKFRQAGAIVSAGDLLGEVGQLIDNHNHAGHSSMLHIEMYTNTDLDPTRHPLTVRGPGGGLMQRRSDVTNPAPYLDSAAA